MKKNRNAFYNRLIERDIEEIQLLAMTNWITPVLKEIWDNEKNEIYNDL